MRRHTFPTFADALTRIHNPADPIDVSIDGAAWRRLAYDELLAGQVSLALVRAKIRRLSGRPLVGDGRIVEKLRAALPYSLTASQEFALAEINADLADPERMPSVSALHSCTSYADGSGAATSPPLACCSTRIRSARPQNAGCR